MKKFERLKLNSYRITFEAGSMVLKAFCKRKAKQRAREMRDEGIVKVTGKIMDIEKISPPQKVKVKYS